MSARSLWTWQTSKPCIFVQVSTPWNVLNFVVEKDMAPFEFRPRLIISDLMCSCLTSPVLVWHHLTSPSWPCLTTLSDLAWHCLMIMSDLVWPCYLLLGRRFFRGPGSRGRTSGLPMSLLLLAIASQISWVTRTMVHCDLWLLVSPFSI